MKWDLYVARKKLVDAKTGKYIWAWCVMLKTTKNGKEFGEYAPCSRYPQKVLLAKAIRDLRKAIYKNIVRFK